MFKAGARAARGFGGCVGLAARRRWQGLATLVLVAVSGLSMAMAQVPPSVPGSAAALHAQRLELQPQLRANAFGEPLVLRSRESADRIEGDVYAEVAFPFAAIDSALRTGAGLCELMVLHLNVRACTPSGGDRVTLVVGPKRNSGSGTEYRIGYVMHADVADSTQLRVRLSAAEGPLSTRDYRMVFEAVPIDRGRSFVHFGYSYGYGLMARMAMAAYMTTGGRDKIGFTVVGHDADGRPTYVAGERAAIERNAMRYYLALLAHCSVTNGSNEEQSQARLRTWFALTERHAAQLHEYDLADYLREKRADQIRLAAAR